jgi:hypothetical protein
MDQQSCEQGEVGPQLQMSSEFKLIIASVRLMLRRTTGQESQIYRKLQRATRLELATFSLGILSTARSFFRNFLRLLRQIHVQATHVVRPESDFHVAEDVWEAVLAACDFRIESQVLAQVP